MKSYLSNHTIGASAPSTPASSIRHFPISIFGSVMSIAGLSLAWRLASKTYGADIDVSNGIGIFAILLFIVLSLCYLSKLYKFPDVVKSEFLHPIIGSFFGTIGISILLISREGLNK